MIWFFAYVAVGIVLFGVFWKVFDISWSAEATDTKLMMTAIPLAWPLFLLLIFLTWVYDRT